MRLVGIQEREQEWRSKVRTLGPFCLLLWDDPFNRKANINMTLYRGTELTPKQIAEYEKMAKNPHEHGSFQAYTSCSRNRKKAEEFGNVVFIMEVLLAFTADIHELSKYPEEEEELVMPGVCFRVTKVEFDHNSTKHLIYLELRQRFNSK